MNVTAHSIPSETEPWLRRCRLSRALSYDTIYVIVTTKQILDMGRNVQVSGFPTKRSVWGMIYIVRSSDNGVRVSGTLRQFMVNH
jgi:hypothetical protein